MVQWSCPWEFWSSHSTVTEDRSLLVCYIGLICIVIDNSKDLCVFLFRVKHFKQREDLSFEGHEVICESKSIAIRILNLGFGWRWVVSFTYLAALPQGTDAPIPFSFSAGYAPRVLKDSLWCYIECEVLYYWVHNDTKQIMHFPLYQV